MCDHGCAALGADPVPPFLRQAQRVIECGGQRVRVAGRHAPTSHAVHDRLGGTAMVGRDHHSAHSLRLDHGAAECFRCRAGTYDHVGQQQRGWHVIALAHQAQTVRQAQPLRLPHQLLAEPRPPLVRANQHAYRVGAGHAGHGVEQHGPALPSGYTGGQNNRGPSVRQPPDLRQLGQPAGADAVRVEHRRVDAAGDDADAVGRHAMLGRDQPGHVLAGGDHAVAAGHHAVVQPLAPPAIGIRAMVGRHERHPCPARGDPGGPARGAASSVDQRHSLLLDNPAQPPGIQQYIERILGRERQADMPPPRARHRGYEPSAGANDQRPAATIADRLRDLDRTPLYSSGLKLRQDLQYRRGRWNHPRDVPCFMSAVG